VPTVPRAPGARIAANVAAIRVLRELSETGHAATPEQQRTLSAWSSWGAVPQVFDESNPTYAAQREQLRDLLSDTEWDAASRTTINAHYTDPTFAAAMWSGLADLGFTGGTVLEPGCGSGTFIGLAPEGARMTGVELDPVTAAIAGHLYPQATVVAESFATTRTPAGTYDAVIGNVPFANVTLTDPVHNQARHVMHNHFILKSLALTKPGGTVAVLTSRYTMDAQNPAARRAIAEQAVLLGAVRLPNGAHQRTAGTQVITDLLVLRKRDGTESAADLDWERAEPADLGEGSLRINTYFQQRPQQVLGAMSYDAGRYDSGDLRVTATGEVAPALEHAVRRIVTGARAAGLTHHPRDLTDAERGVAALTGAQVDRFVGHLAHSGGQFTRRTAAGVDEVLEVPRTQQGELARLLGLRDGVVAVLEAEAADSDDTPELVALRSELAARYDAYVAVHGPLQRVTERRTGRVDPDTGAQVMAQIRPAVMRTFASDPFAPTVRALEIYDAQTQTASKAAILSQRVVAPRQPRLGADTPADALAICVDTHAEVRLPEVARLLGTSTDTAREGLRGLVFDDPVTGRLLAAAEYLSGDARTRLAAANAAAVDDPRFAENVAALTEVIPDDLGPGDIDARLGAAWVDADDVQVFLQETLEDRSVRVVHTVGADWSVKGGRFGVLSTSQWGTDRVPAPQLAQALLKQAPIRVTDEMEDGSKVFNPTETAAAQDKARELGDRFAEWVWEDPERADRLAGVYNERFNALVLRSYDTTHMELPGLARTFTPRPHQLSAVARMVAEPNAGLFHAVGAGKTAEMAIGVMELRRLGLVRKPAIVVPNHMLDQFSAEFLQLYPQARVLAAGSDELAGDKRRDFVARTTAGQWDAVIMTRTAFKRLEVSDTTKQAYLDNQVLPQREALARLVGDPESAMTVKRLEKMLLANEERIKSKLGKATDPGVLFEMTGIDYLVVDELHDYKNLATPSNIRDAAIEGSDRAADLHMKVEYLRTKHNGRAITGATATPIANSITEAYVMQRYLRPDLLVAAGVHDFDTWAGTFGSTVTEMEMSPDGGSWRLKTRFAKFRNIPEFLRMWHVAADVKTPEDLALPTPQLARRPDGQRASQTIVIEPSEEVVRFVQSLGERAEAVRNGSVEPREDNMLKITSEGRAAALDLRLLPHARTETEVEGVQGAVSEVLTPGKVDAAAERIAAVWRENSTRDYLGADGQSHPRQGGLQLVFSDLGTPREAWNVYDAVKSEVVARGVPAEQVAFIHSARNDREKAALFEACRTGQVQVLLGSTAKMGVGTNVQDRAVALHHLDCPWRPADLAQREGRIERQGNQNPEITIYRYVTESTFDTYSWQTVERKARFIGQVMKGRLDSREVEDVGDAALSYNEVKALASGNPLLLDRAEADATVAGLERLRRAHDRGQAMLRHKVGATERGLSELHTSLVPLHAAINRRVPTKGEAFAATINDTRHTERAAAATALAARLAPELTNSRGYYRHELGELGALGGFTATAAVVPSQQGPQAVVTFTDCPARPVAFTAADLRQPGPGLLIRLENTLTGLDRTLTETHASINTLTLEHDRAQARLGAPFDRMDQLLTARAKREEITERMTADQNPSPTAADPEHAPTPVAGWRTTLGPRPQQPAPAQQWDVTVSMVDAYRSTYAITDPAQALGPEPAPGTEQAAAHRAINREWVRATSPSGNVPTNRVAADTTLAASSPPLGSHRADLVPPVAYDGITDDSGYGYQQSYTDRHRADGPNLKAGY